MQEQMKEKRYTSYGRGRGFVFRIMIDKKSNDHPKIKIWNLCAFLPAIMSIPRKAAFSLSVICHYATAKIREST